MLDRKSGAAVSSRRLRLGELLVQAGLLTEEKLQEILPRARQSGLKLGEYLLREGIISREQLISVLESQLGIRSVDLRVAPIDYEAARRIPENMARRHMVIPIQITEGQLLLAMKDPLDQLALQDVRLVAGMPVVPLLAAEEDIRQAIERVFGQQRAAQRAAEELARTAAVADAAEEAAAALELESAPMVRLVNSIIENAVRGRASDIHIEPKPDRLRIRHRVDGVLFDALNVSMRVHGPLVSRIKVMANMNIAEKRLPQDGKITTYVDRRKIDLRVSTMPTTYGEKVAIRILDRAAFLIGKENLGFSSSDIIKFERLISHPYGLILVTGPTGSGKTTTLYNMLSEMDRSSRSLVTLEDPIEYDLDDVMQTQINVQAGLTFASGLRALLRQDPDVIMVGEIRDAETAEIAVRAALTGHLVMSTLHTNDAPGAVVRLMDIGIEPYLIASSLVGVIAQRLVRKICPECREEYVAEPYEREILGVPPDEELILARGRGCARCNQSGYQGRTGVFEILEIDRELKVLINQRLPLEELRQAAIMQGMVPLWEDCRSKVIQRITTLAEALRVTQSY